MGCAMVSSTQHGEIFGDVLASFGAPFEVVEVEEDGVPASGDATAVRRAAQDFAA